MYDEYTCVGTVCVFSLVVHCCHAAHVYKVIIVRVTVMRVYYVMLMITGIYMCGLLNKGWNQW